MDGGKLLDATALDALASSSQPVTEADALRLRKALRHLKSSLTLTDKEVVALIEEWQEALEEAEQCETRSAKFRAQADELDKRVAEWRQTAAECFKRVSVKLSSAALDVHLVSAPFVAIDQQQALQLQCWLLEGRTWKPIRLAIGNGRLVYSQQLKSMLTRRTRRVQVSLELASIETARSDGDVLLPLGGCCGDVETRWQWTCFLSPAGRAVYNSKRSHLVFTCESELGMEFWVRELHAAKGLPPPATTGAALHTHGLVGGPAPPAAAQSALEAFTNNDAALQNTGATGSRVTPSPTGAAGAAGWNPTRLGGRLSDAFARTDGGKDRSARFPPPTTPHQGPGGAYRFPPPGSSDSSVPGRGPPLATPVRLPPPGAAGGAMSTGGGRITVPPVMVPSPASPSLGPSTMPPPGFVGGASPGPAPDKALLTEGAARLPSASSGFGSSTSSSSGPMPPMRSPSQRYAASPDRALNPQVGRAQPPMPRSGSIGAGPPRPFGAIGIPTAGRGRGRGRGAPPSSLQRGGSRV